MMISSKSYNPALGCSPARLGATVADRHLRTPPHAGGSGRSRTGLPARARHCRRPRRRHPRRRRPRCSAPAGTPAGTAAVAALHGGRPRSPHPPHAVRPRSVCLGPWGWSGTVGAPPCTLARPPARVPALRPAPPAAPRSLPPPPRTPHRRPSRCVRTIAVAAGCPCPLSVFEAWRHGSRRI